MDLKVVDDLQVSDEVYWSKIFLDEEFNRRLFLERLRFSDYRLVSQETRGDQIHRVLVAAPPLGEMPAPLAKLIGESVSYEERGVYSPTPPRYEFQVIPSKLADKVSISGSLRVEPVSASACKRVFEAKIVARILMVGGILEKKIASDLERSQRAGARYTNDWAKDRGL